MKKITLLLLLLVVHCGYAQMPPEDFEGTWSPVPAASGSASDWLVLDNGIGLTYTWVQAVHSSNSTPSYEGTTGSHAAYLQRENVNGMAADYLVTPEFTVPENAEVRFQSRLTVPFDNGGIYRIMLLPEGQDPANINNYVEVYTWPTELDLNPQQTVYTEKVVLIPPAYEGTTVRIAFVMEGDNMDRWLIDHTKVVSDCPNPTGLAASNITMNSAQLTWNNPAGATEWNIDIVGEFQPPTGTGFSYTGTPSYLATTDTAGNPLTPDTEYKYYVQALCDDTGTSDWIGPFAFSTYGPGDTCNYPFEVTTLPYFHNDNTANHTDAYQGQAGVAGCNGSPNAAAYLGGNEAVYHFTAGFTGNIVIDIMNNDPFSSVYIYEDCSDIGISCINGANSGYIGDPININNIPVTAGEDYYIVVSSSSVFEPTTPYTLMIQQQGCEEPVGQPVTDIGTTSATFSWTNPSMSSSWQLEVQQVGAGLPAGAGEYTATVSTGYQVSDLLPATNYEYYVRADCGNGTFSAWAGPYLFSTSVCEEADQCIYTFVMKDTFANGWTAQTINVSQGGVILAVLAGPPNGSATQEVQVQACSGIPLEVFWNEGPDAYEYATEIGLDILNSYEQVIYTMPVPPMSTGFQGTLLYSGNADCNTLLCIPPTGLEVSNIDMDSADLSWDGPATGNWEYYIVNSGSPAPGAATSGTVTTSNPVLGVPLAAPATNYDFYVRMQCPDGNYTDWSGPLMFGSPSCAAEDKCDYVFTMGSFMDWGWFGGYMTIKQDGIVVANIGQSYITGASQSVTVPLCHNMPFEIFWTAEGDAGGGPGIGSIYTLDVYNSFGQSVYSMPMDSGALLGTTIFTGTVDCEHPLCIPPVGLYAENITTTTADIGWAGIATGNWEYHIAEAGQPAPTDATSGTPTTSNPTQDVPLATFTEYEFYVRQVCENDPAGHSEWAGPFPFHTEFCNEADKCLYSFEMLSKPPSFGYSMHTMTISQGGHALATIGGWDFMNGNSMTVQVPLCPGLDIDIFWNDEEFASNDGMIALNVYDPYSELVYHKGFGEGTPGTQLFSGSVTCLPPSCYKPLNLTVTNETLTSATLHWDEMGTATSWRIWVLPLGSPAPVPGTGGIVVTDNPYTYEGLNPSTPYVWYVMAMCGDGDNSSISLQGSFHTLINNDECAAAISIPVNPGIDCIESLSGTLVGDATYSGVGVEPAIWCGYPPGYPDVWFSFVAENTTHIVDQTVANANIYIVIYKGNCDAPEQIYCNSASPVAILHDLTVGETYYIRVMKAGEATPFTPLDFNFCILTPVAPVIAVSDFTDAQQMVEEKLMSPACGVVSNVTTVSGSDFGYENSIGYFDQNGSTFPMTDGLLIATGGIDDAVGPSPGAHMHLTSAAWPGDADLTAIFPDLTSLGSSNASIVEFDFVPETCHIGFDFIFASDIYSAFRTSWSCESNNGFAILLTGPMSDPNPPTVNLAVIPGTTTPIGIASIRPEESIYPGTCDPVNEGYFGVLNDLDPVNSPSPIAYNGQTVVMQAFSQVLQGETYHMKIVIDDKDVHSVGCHDSALFIKGHECSDMVDLGPDLIIENGTAICYGSTTTLDTGLDPDIFDFTWRKDGETLAGETSETLTVTGESPFGGGTYSVFANYEGTNCGISGSVEVEFYDEILFSINDATICQGNTGTLTITPGFTGAAYTWTHEGETVGTDASLPVSEAGTYEVAITLHGCTVSGTAEVTILPLPVADDPADIVTCESYTLPALSPGNSYYTGADGTGTQLNAGEVITSNQTIYILAQSTSTPVCTAENSFTITILPPPVFNLGGAYIACADEEVAIAITNVSFDTALATYSWTWDNNPLPDTGSSITATEFGTYAVTVTLGDCAPVTQSVEVQENTVAIAVQARDFCENNTLMLEAISDNGSFNPDTAVFAWTGPDGFTAGTQQFVVPSGGTYTIVVTTPEGCVGTAVTDIVSTACSIQRGISPNNDGSNDSFDLANLDVSRLAIFNRYGIEVYTKNNYTTEWNGQTDSGDELPSGTYFYMIERRNGEQLTGWIYINREE